MGLREKNTIIAQKTLNKIASPVKSRIINLGGNWTENGKPIVKNGPLYRYHYGIRAQIGGLPVAHEESAGVITITVKTSDTISTGSEITADSTLTNSKTIATYEFAGTDLKDMVDTEILRTEIPQNAKRYLQAEVSGTNFTNATDFLAEFIPMPLV